MIVDLPRRWRWVIGIATVCAVLLAVVFVFASRPPGDALVAQAVQALRANDAPVARVNDPILQAGLPAPNDSHGTDEVQVCGGAWVKRTGDGSPDPADFERATGLAESRDRVLASMRADSAELPRAVALLLSTDPVPPRGKPAFEARVAANVAAAACTANANCPPDPVAAAAADRERDAADHARDAIAQLAAESNDPRVYALAYKRCDLARGAGACQLINARRWAQIDPGNAMPWINLFSEARARGDVGTQNEALHRIGAADRSDDYFFSAAGAILDAAPETDSALPANTAMLAEAGGFEAAAINRVGDVVNACRGEALRDSNRAQTCSAIANVLVDHSENMLSRHLGLSIGRSVGWTADRLDLANAEMRAYGATIAQARMNAPENDYGCEPLRREVDQLRHLADVGEVAAMREWVAASGKTPQQFIDEQRAAARSARAAAEQAKAASGPS